MTAIATVRFEIVDVTEDADLRRQLADALAAVEEWRAAANDRMIERDTERAVRDREASEANRTRAELASARAENERLRGELAKAAEARDIAQRGARQAGADLDHCENSRELMRTERDEARARFNDLCNTDRSAARLVAMIAERDRAIAERDEARKPFAGLFSDLAHLRKMEQGLRVQLANAEADRNAARKALAAQIEKTNKCTRALNAYPGVAELAALRTRVAELEGELTKAEKQRDENHASAREWRSFFDTVIKERDAARIEVITAKNKLTDARASLDRLI